MIPVRLTGRAALSLTRGIGAVALFMLRGLFRLRPFYGHAFAAQLAQIG